MEAEEKRNSEPRILALFAGTHIRSALEAGLVTYAADVYFGAHGERVFHTHPANTLPYGALSDREDISILNLFEAVDGVLKFHAIDIGLDLDKLKLHRDMIAHPVKAKWRKADRQAFADAGHHHSQVRVGFVWSTAKRIDAALASTDFGQILAEIPGNWHMAEMLSLILRLSVRDGFTIHAVGELLTFLKSVGPKFVQMLEKYPDGTDPLDEPPPVEEGSLVRCVEPSSGLVLRNRYKVIERCLLDCAGAVPVVRVQSVGSTPPVPENQWFAAKLFEFVRYED